jgi:uncharacterized protein YndB with AHSA1/START domain
VSEGTAGTGPAVGRPGTITTVHRYELPLGRPQVWALISDVRAYRSWWTWLRIFEAAALAEGEEWRCEVQPPVPYPVRFQVAIDHVRAPALVRARVLGDVQGEATLTLEDVGDGTVATLHSALAPGNRALRLVSRFAAPLARFGHDWVLDSGARQFVARAVPAVGGDTTAA